VRTLKLVVAYDGTAFHGWQAQPGQRTVQGVLEEALSRVLDAQVAVTSAGRTDAGTHARGQVASVRVDASLPTRAFAPSLQRHLPEDVRVVQATDVAAEFDARRSATARRYAYRLLDRDDVLWQRFAWHPRMRLDADALERAVAPLAGEHDCAAFQSTGSTPTRTGCRVYRAGWRRWEAGLVLDVISDHFLYHMVRTIVGTALAAARTADPGRAMRAVLDSRRRARAGATAPACGLCLEQVFYPPEVA
jgi:tRNA pseudouridine38-40 synthase